MNIVITLAGQSRRFKEAGYKEPKFLIEIEGRPIISHVVEMFDLKDKFYFILNTEQIKAYPNIPDLLRTLAKKVEIIIIPPHELGPVFSALQIQSISDKDEVIISYCDFLVEWNYKNFLNRVRGYDGGIPSFKGFHPASFGKTYYAYMRVDNEDNMLELREKNSFTDKRSEEFASAGIYYFRKWGVFKDFAHRMMQEGFENLKEGYVSLLFNPMVKAGLKILVSEVKKFICLGTPEDLDQYYFWYKYFHSTQKQILPKNIREQVNLMPMAGQGKRFKDYGYRISKTLIIVQEKPMVIQACNSFPGANKWVFLVRSKDLEKFFLHKTLTSNFSDCKVIPVNYDTSGQLATCLIAKKEINTDSSLFIASSDYETRFSIEKWNEIIADESIDVVIWTCRIGSNLTKNPKAFAYCVVKENSNQVYKIVEKDTISDTPEKDPLVVGSFWFRKAKDFFDLAKEVIEKNITVNGEHYIGNGINLMIKAGKKVVIFDVDQWISYGDPFELEVFFYWEEYFFKKTKYINTIEN